MKSFVKKLLVSAAAITLGAVSSFAQSTMNAAGLPLFFEAGRGQAGITTPFAAHGPNSEFLLASTNVQFALRKTSGETAAASMAFVGANPSATISGVTELAGKVNYFLGNDPAKWQSGVPIYSKVRVEDIYPGVNVVYYGNGRQLEYDFDLAAGVDPKTIAIRFDGAENISVNSQGELVVNLNGGQIIQHSPVIYQMAGQSRREITGGYKLMDSHTATFALDGYDRSLPLVIDPILSYSTYFGGNKGSVIYALALSKDGSNSIFVAGQTVSTVFTNDFFSKFQPGYQTNFQGGTTWGDAFVAKLDNSGTNPIYFTYLGGNADEVPFGIAVDANGNAFVTGFTDSPNFPTTNACYPHIAGKKDPSAGLYPVDAFVTEINPGGTNLVYSTYLGGSQADVGTAIALDSNDNAYVAGYTYSTNLPVQPGAFQSTLQCTNYTLYFNANAFLAEIPQPPNTNLLYCSYFGGNNYDEATAITLGESNYIYVAGATASTNFPVVYSWTNQLHLNGTNFYNTYDAFVAKFAPGFASLVYSTYLGGSNFDMATGIAVDNSAGYAYVVGSTVSPNFTNHFGSLNYVNQPANNGGLLSCVITNTSNIAAVTNAFLAQIGWTGTNAYIGYALLFGGNGNDVANGISMDGAGNLYVVGSASSTNYPVTPGNLYGSLRATNSASSPTQSSDAVITAFASNASLIYSAYLGGPGDDHGNAIAADSAGTVYIAGQTASTVFPTFNAVQTNLTGSVDGFIAKILPVASQPVLQAAVSGTNLLVSWQGFAQETPTTFLLVSKTNLLSTNAWSVVTNWPATNSGTYIYTLPHTNAVKFFRLQQN